MKPKLLPVEVPWEIESSSPTLELFVIENGDAATRINVSFGQESERNVGESEPFGESDCVRIEIVFRSVSYASMLPPETGLNVLKEDEYDWSGVSYRTLLNQDPRQWRKLLMEEWGRTGFCADSGMYEMIGDPSSNEPEARRLGCKTYVVLGHDSFVKVAARSWKWRRVE